MSSVSPMLEQVFDLLNRLWHNKDARSTIALVLENLNYEFLWKADTTSLITINDFFLITTFWVIFKFRTNGFDELYRRVQFPLFKLVDVWSHFRVNQILLRAIFRPNMRNFITEVVIIVLSICHRMLQYLLFAINYLVTRWNLLNDKNPTFQTSRHNRQSTSQPACPPSRPIYPPIGTPASPLGSSLTAGDVDHIDTKRWSPHHRL